MWQIEEKMETLCKMIRERKGKTYWVGMKMYERKKLDLE
jgi:hypothetical protein